MAYAKTEDLKRNWMDEIQVARYVNIFCALTVIFGL